MSAIEPPTTDKLEIVTTKGALEISLWAKETPTASKSLSELAVNHPKQLCIGRVLKGRYVELAVEGLQLEPAVNELNSRIRLAYPFMVAVDLRRNPNLYVITLGSSRELAMELSGWTILGRVDGNSVYWLHGLEGNATVRDDDGVLEYPVRGISGRVVGENYFSIELKKQQEVKEKKRKRIEPKKQVTLSFGGDEEEDEGGETNAAPVIRMKSAFRVRKKIKKDETVEKPIEDTKSLEEVEETSPSKHEASEVAASSPPLEPVKPRENETLEMLRKFQDKFKQDLTGAKKADSGVKPTLDLQLDDEEEGLDGLSEEEDDMDFLKHRFGS